MRIYYEYSHLGGREILQVHFPALLEEIRQIIHKVEARRTKISRERPRYGVRLFSPTGMNRQFKALFRERGWRELRDRYELELPNYPDKQKLYGFKQIDFAKEKVLVEVQFGKYAFMFYDLAKFQYFYNEAQAEVGVEISCLPNPYSCKCPAGLLTASNWCTIYADYVDTSPPCLFGLS